MQGEARCVGRGRGKPLPYGTVRNNRRGANLRAADSRPYGGDMTSPRWMHPASVRQRDVEDAVLYGTVRNSRRGANLRDVEDAVPYGR